MLAEWEHPFLYNIFSHAFTWKTFGDSNILCDILAQGFLYYFTDSVDTQDCLSVSVKAININIYLLFFVTI